MDLIEVPLSIFLIIVAPLWLILHYRSKRQTNQGLSEKDQENLQSLINRTEKLQDRIISLELILDEESPKWRDR